MNRKRLYIEMLLVVGTMVLMMGCSASKNTAKSRFWQSFTAKYNVFYNGKVAYIDGSLEKEKGNKDNYTEMLPLYAVSNKASQQLGSGNFDKAIEKCEKTIKLHSIKKKPEWTKNRRKTEKDIEWLSRREYNPMMWKAWMLMGRSQFSKGDFDAASATFSYMSRMYQTQPAIYVRARAWLAKCYVEQEWLYDAEDVLRNLSRDSIPHAAEKELNYTYCDYYLHAGDYEKAVPYLQKVIKQEGRKVQKAREWFILGQVYSELGKTKEAFKAYSHVVRLNPPYELSFNARIAQTEVLAANQSKKMISKLKRMASNENNKEYLDQVYYAIGNIYMAQKDTVNAIAAYEKGREKATRNGMEKGVLLLRLGDIYWDMERYSNAQGCYGEAIGLLDKERKDYKQLAERSKVLDELVPFTDAVFLQDSLLELSQMPEAERNAAIDRVIKELKRKEKEERDRLAEQQAEETIQRNGGNTAGNNTPAPQVQQQQNGLWYFYNTMAVNQGKTAFQKQWGKRENVDHWQRINKTVVNFGDEEEPDLSNLTQEQLDSIAALDLADAEGEEPGDTLANDPHNREYYLAQIPFEEDQKLACYEIIKDGLYNSGVIFKDKLDNLPLSKKQFDRLTSEFADFERMDDAYYHMFLLYSRMGQADKAAACVDSLVAAYPESQWTILLTDPYFEDNQRFGVHIEDSLYTATYNAFKADRHNEIIANARISAERFPLGANRDKFVFISGLSKLNNGDAEGCLEDMNTVVKEYSQSKLATLAGMIVNGVKQGKTLRGGKFDIDDVWARRAITLNDNDSTAVREFVDDRNIDFEFLVAYEPETLNENQLLYELAKFNFTSYLVRNFTIEVEDQDGLHVMRVSGFRNYDEAIEYRRQLMKRESVVARIGEARVIVISAPNAELLGVNFSYDDYDKYYDEHFSPAKEDDARLLDEPEYDGEDLDDGGSLPSNVAPVTNGNNNGNDNDNANVNPNGNEDTLIIEEDNANVNPNGNEDTLIIEEDNANVNDNDNGNDNEDTLIIEDEDANVNPNVNGNEDVMIIEDEQVAPAPAGNDDTIIIEDEQVAPSQPNDSNTFIIEDEDSSTADDDEYYELDGF